MHNSLFKLKWLPYCTGFFAILLLNNSLLTMLIYRYDPGVTNPSNLPFLVPSVLVGMAMLISQIGSAVTQPIIGNISDRLWSRWGRRRPFLAASALPLVISYIFLFNPSAGETKLSNLAYLIILLCLFYLAFAVYQVSYLAWMPTLARTAKQRVNLSGLMAIFGFLGMAIGGIGAPWLTQQYDFEGMAGILGSISFVALLLPLAVREELMPSKSEVHPTFWKSLQSAGQNPYFRSYMLGFTLAWIAISILLICPTLLAVALLNRKIVFGAVINGIVLGSALVGFTLVIPLVRSWGKRRTFQWTIVWWGGGLLAVGIWPNLVGTALIPWMLLLIFSNLGLASLFILPNAMLADVIDKDKKQFGVRREALYFGVRGLLQQISQGIGVLFAGMVLMLGKTPAAPLGVQLAFPLAGLFALAAAWAFSFYPIAK